MNPTFTVSIDLEKRKTSVTGLVAVGEKVNVVISGFGDYSVPEWELDNTEGFSGAALRFRLVTPDGKDLVRFPLVEGDKWDSSGGDFSAEVDFNTMQLRNWLRGFPIDGKAEVGVIVDSVVDAMEYGRGTIKILQWAASPAEDPTILPDWRKTLRDLNAAIVEISSKTEWAESAAQTAESARDEARISKGSAETAANNALSSESAAKVFKNDAESASVRASTSAEEAKASQTAAESAKTAAESARDEAKGYAEAAESALANAATKAELQAEVERATAAEEENASAIDETGEALATEVERAKTAEQNLANEVSEVGDKVDTLVAGDANKSARTIAAEEVAKVVANAPADLDTLKEIADYINSDKTGAAQMVTQIDANAKAISAEVKRAQEAEANKVDKVEGKGLSTNDFTTAEKEKLGKAYTPDNPPPTPDLSGYATKEDVAEDLSSYVTLAGDQTITGLKTFESILLENEQGGQYLYPHVIDAYTAGGLGFELWATGNIFIGNPEDDGMTIYMPELSDDSGFSVKFPNTGADVFVGGSSSNLRFQSDGLYYTLDEDALMTFSISYDGFNVNYPLISLYSDWDISLSTPTIGMYINENASSYGFTFNRPDDFTVFSIDSYDSDIVLHTASIMRIAGELLELNGRDGFTFSDQIDSVNFSSSDFRQLKNIIGSATPYYNFNTGAVEGGVLRVASHTVTTYSANGAEMISVEVNPDGNGVCDCVLVLECGNVSPKITWPANFHPRTSAVDFACVAGVKNVYWISEYAQGEYVVAGWQVTDGGGTSEGVAS